jgi:signal transduction histidine kinase
MDNPSKSKIGRSARSPRAAGATKAVRGNGARSIAETRLRATDKGRQAAIERAKLEWESTADALGSLVCLLRNDGKVVRANRVVEDWTRCTVSSVLGVSAHALLHPGCKNKQCEMAAFMKMSLAQIRRGSTRQFELQQDINMRYLQLTIRPMRRRVGGAAERGDPRAVLVAIDQSALYRARGALELLNSNLETRVRSRTQALADANRDLRNEIIRREQAEVALRTSRNELRALSEQLIGAQESERKRIAVELHDSVGQSLSAVKYSLERGVEMLRSPKLGDPAAVFQLAVQRIQETAESIRYISTNLRPRILDELGAASAVHWFCRDFANTYPSLAVVVDVKLADDQVPDRLATVVYRCLQELLNNVAKHSKAGEVQIELSREADVLMLQVSDNGVGLNSATEESRRHGSGLRNMRERAQMTGGKFAITQPDGGGTVAQLHWALDQEDLYSEPVLA